MTRPASHGSCGGEGLGFTAVTAQRDTESEAVTVKSTDFRAGLGGMGIGGTGSKRHEKPGGQGWSRVLSGSKECFKAWRATRFLTSPVSELSSAGH